MSRRGRFGKFCWDYQSRLAECQHVMPSFQQHLEQKNHPAVLVGEYIQLLCKHRKKNLWKGSHYEWLSPLNPEDTFLKFWSTQTLRGVPHKVNQVLIHWYLGTYPLVLIHHIPSAEEMLTVQSQGIRFVTLFIREEEWVNNIIHQRDHLSFTLHDLIHAYEFFYNTSLKNQQIHFYRKLKNHYHHLATLSQDPIYHHALNYLISDMNSHPSHLEVYFHGLLKRFNITPYNLDL